MINGNLNDFMDTLFWGEELEVIFRDVGYFIQGYYKNIGTESQVAHLEMFALDGGEDSDVIVWQMDDRSMSACATAFLRAKVWDGMDFYQAEREIEWVG